MRGAATSSSPRSVAPTVGDGDVAAPLVTPYGGARLCAERRLSCRRFFGSRSHSIGSPRHGGKNAAAPLSPRCQPSVRNFDFRGQTLPGQMQLERQFYILRAGGASPSPRTNLLPAWWNSIHSSLRNCRRKTWRCNPSCRHQHSFPSGRQAMQRTVNARSKDLWWSVTTLGSHFPSWVLCNSSAAGSDPAGGGAAPPTPAIFIPVCCNSSEHGFDP